MGQLFKPAVPVADARLAQSSSSSSWPEDGSQLGFGRENHQDATMAQYGPWTKDTPHTDAKATICCLRHVKGVRAIEVHSASYRNATLSGTFELADQSQSNTIKTYPSGKRKVAVICAWFSVQEPNKFPELDLTELTESSAAVSSHLEKRYRVIEQYTGEVADNIARKVGVTPRPARLEIVETFVTRPDVPAIQEPVPVGEVLGVPQPVSDTSTRRP